VAEIVYILGAALSALCSILLFRGYARSRVRLLLWSGLCFAGLAINNAILFADLIVVPDVDLSLPRGLAGLAGLALLLYGLVWESL